MSEQRRPAPSAEPVPGSSRGSRRPEPRPGRSRARLSLLLPALALLLGALSLFHAAPAEASHTLPTPTNLQAQTGNGQVTLTWAGGENHWNYDVAHGEHPSGTLSTRVVLGAANRTVTITGLTNGTTYRFRVRVRATQGHSTSGWTDFVTATPAAQQTTAPAAPTNLSVTPGDGYLALSWTAPTGTLTGYDVHYTSAAATGNGAVANSATASGSNPATAWVAENHSGTSSFWSIYSLSNRTSYRVRVRAKNSGGSGAWVFGSGTPELFLLWPGIVQGMGEDTTGLTLRISPGAAAASVAVSGTLTYAAGSNNPASLADDLTSGYATTFSAQANAIPTINIPDPVDDTVNEEHETYTVTINAGTGYKVGPPSTITVTIRDNDPPSAPSGLTLQAGGQKLTASWTKPVGPVAGYQLRHKETSAADQTATTAGDPSTGWVTSTPSGTGTSADITGLTNGTAYHVQVRATDGQTQTGNGYGDWSASQSGTPAAQQTTVPAAPTNLVVSPGNAQLSLTWTAPTGTLTGYDVHYTSAAAGTVGNNVAVQTGGTATAATGWLAVTRSGTTASQTISPLSNGTHYRVRVRAVNAVGDGAWVFGTGTPAMPTVSFQQNTLLVVESDTEPEDIVVLLSSAQTQAVTVGISVVAGATASAADYTLSATSVTFVAGETTKSFTFLATADMMSEGNEVATLRLTPPAGIGLGSNPNNEVVIVDDSKDPPTLTATPGDRSLSLTWTDGGVVVLDGWDVHYTSAPKSGTGAVTDTAAATGSNAAAAWVAVTRTGPAKSQTISSLSNGTTYRLRVRWFTLDDMNMRVASGDWFFGTGTPKGPPAAPTDLALSGLETSFEVTWTASTSTGAAAPTYYEVAFDVATRTVSNLRYTARTTSGTATSLTIDSDSSGLTIEEATQYRATIRACNPSCSGYAGNETAWTTVREPAGIANLAVTPGDGTLALSWTLDFGGGLAAPTAYEVAYTASTTVDNDASVGSDPATGWVDAGHSGTGTSYTITGLTNGQEYRVRVESQRVVNTTNNVSAAVGLGKGTPQAGPASTVSLSASPTRVVEGSSVTVTATLSAPAASALTIPVTVSTASPNTAESGDVGTLTSISIAAGATKGTGTITTSHDSGDNDETFTVSLGSSLPGGLLAGTALVTVTIVDDEGAVRVAFARATATLCEGGPRKNLPRLVLSRRPVQNYAAVWVTLDRGTAEWRDHSFAGQTPISIQWTRHAWFDTPLSIQAYDDNDSDFEEFTVQIDESRMPRGFVAVSPKKVKVTIVDSDLWGQDGCDIQPARLSVKARWRGVEGSGRWIPFTVSVDRDSLGPFTVDYRTEDVTARSDGTKAAGTKDYVPASGTLTFGPTERSKEVRVFLLDDEIEDRGETFRLVLHNPQGAVIEQGVGIGTILNHEQYVDATKLRAAFERVPARSSGTEAFWFDLRFTEALGETANAPSAASFAVKGGRIDRVWKVEAGLWRLRVEPEAWREVTVTLAGGRGCDAAGAVCTADGRALVNSPVATVASPERPLSSNADLSGLSAQAAGADGRWSALDLGAFWAGKTGNYTVTVPYGTTQVRLTATAAHAGAALKAGAAGSLSAVPSGAAGPSIALDVGANALAVQVTAEDGTARTYRVTVTREAAQQESEPEPQGVVQQEEESAQQQQSLDPLTAAFEGAPPEHDGRAAFALDVRFSEAPGGVAPSAASFRVAYGSVAGVGRVSAGLYRVRVKPKSWRDVKVTLAPPSDCAAPGAVCASGGRALSNALTATIGGPVRIRVEGARQSGAARAKEGKDEALEFAVTLNRAAAREVSVDYATADDTATAGADYTAVSGTLVFAAGETAKTVSVPVLDDAVDEGKETMRLKLSNPRGAYLRSIHRQARGIIVNDDPLQRAWLARFGRTAAGHVSEAIGGRLRGEPGRRVVLGGQQLAGGGAFFAQASGGRPGRASLPAGSFDLRTGEEREAPWRELEMSELLLASSFHLASAESMDAGFRWSVWGRGARTSFEGTGDGLSLDGDVTTATVGFDYERARWLVGVALARSSGDGAFRAGGACDTGCAGELESSLTGVYPYARYRVSGTFSVWGAVGHGQGDMRLAPEGQASMEADVDMGMAAAGARGVLLPARTAGGFELALRADVLVTNMRSDAAAGLAETEAETRRVRLVLEGSRSFEAGAGMLTPSVEIGFRNDSGDAETGGGVEAGGSLRYASGDLSVEVRGRSLLAHGESEYEEWGASASVEYAPGGDGRGLTLRAGSAWGTASGGAERLWSQAAGLAPGAESEAGAGRFEAEAAYGVSLRRGLLTPYTGVAVSGSGETWRAGARWKPGPAYEVSLEASLTDPAGVKKPGGGVLLRGARRW